MIRHSIIFNEGRKRGKLMANMVAKPLCLKFIYFSFQLIRVLSIWNMHPFEMAIFFCSVQECMSTGF